MPTARSSRRAVRATCAGSSVVAGRFGPLGQRWAGHQLLQCGAQPGVALPVQRAEHGRAGLRLGPREVPGDLGLHRAEQQLRLQRAERGADPLVEHLGVAGRGQLAGRSRAGPRPAGRCGRGPAAGGRPAARCASGGTPPAAGAPSPARRGAPAAPRRPAGRRAWPGTRRGRRRPSRGGRPRCSRGSRSQQPVQLRVGGRRGRAQTGLDQPPFDLADRGPGAGAQLDLGPCGQLGGGAHRGQRDVVVHELGQLPAVGVEQAGHGARRSAPARPGPTGWPRVAARTSSVSSAGSVGARRVVGRDRHPQPFVAVPVGQVQLPLGGRRRVTAAHGQRDPGRGQPPVVGVVAFGLQHVRRVGLVAVHAR